MDCTTINTYLDDYLDEMLDDATSERIEAHEKTCPDCRNRLARERNFRQALRNLPEPALDPDFAARAFKKAAAIRTERSWIDASVFLKIAASVLAVVALGFLLKGAWLSGQPDLPSAYVRLNQPEEVQLVFYSGEDLENVTLSLLPPEGIELVGFENQRKIVWQADLKKGENLLVLPVIARSRDGGSLVAKIHHGKRDKQFQLLLKVRQPNDPVPGVDRLESSVAPTRFI